MRAIDPMSKVLRRKSDFAFSVVDNREVMLLLTWFDMTQYSQEK
jgi:hypothetical protein